MFKKFSGQRGVTLLELLISLSVMSGVVVGITQLVQDAGDDTRASVTALHTRTVGDAASAYIKDNYAAITAVATATAPVLIRVPDLIAAGYLTPGFSVTNPSRQATCVVVLEPTANRLSGMVLTEGGDAIDDLTLGQVAATIGGAGGGLYSTAPTTATGAMGGYSFAVGAYANPNSLGQRCDGTAGNIAISAGHPVMALAYADAAQGASTLYRDAVPGNPSLNTMNTPILMGAGSQQTVGAACTTVGAIASSSTGAVLSCESGVWKQGGSAFWADPVANAAGMPACTAALLNQTRVVQTPSVGTGPRAFTCNGAGSWLPLAVDDLGNLAVAGTATMGGLALTTINVENTACPLNGRVARNAAGATLHCESGVWRRGVNTSGDTMTGRLNNHDDSFGFVMRNSAGADNAAAQSAAGSAYVNDIYLRSLGRWASSLGAADLAPNMYQAWAYGGYNWYNYPGCAAGYTAVYKSHDSTWDNPSQGGASAVIWKTLCARGAGTTAPNI
jgi:prepilin-type N-terminal cleavage/methylation domain-containing protein